MGTVKVPVKNVDETVTLLLTATVRDPVHAKKLAEKKFKFTFTVTHCACKSWELSGQTDVI